jgi:hypothetical protein
VHVSGAIVGNDYQVAKVDVLDGAKMPAIGIVSYKISSTRAIVILDGDVAGVYTGLTPGRVYFVGTNSRPTLTPPNPGPGQKLYLQAVGVAVDTGILRFWPRTDPMVKVG